MRVQHRVQGGFISFFDGGLEWISADGFIADVLGTVKTPDPAPWYRINAMTVIGDTATVQVEDIWLDTHFDDTLLLLHHDGAWIIVSKIFSMRPA